MYYFVVFNNIIWDPSMYYFMDPSPGTIVPVTSLLHIANILFHEQNGKHIHPSWISKYLEIFSSHNFSNQKLYYTFCITATLASNVYNTYDQGIMQQVAGENVIWNLDFFV